MNKYIIHSNKQIEHSYICVIYFSLTLSYIYYSIRRSECSFGSQDWNAHNITANENARNIRCFPSLTPFQVFGYSDRYVHTIIILKVVAEIGNYTEGERQLGFHTDLI